MNNASRQIVDLAASHEPAAIHLEDLSNYQQTVEEPIHDWPYGMLQKQIVYKAQEAGIPVKIVDPAYTSITCRHCGQTIHIHGMVRRSTMDGVIIPLCSRGYVLNVSTAPLERQQSRDVWS